MSILDITGTGEAWQDDALCTQTGIDDPTWFPGVGQPASHARAICRMCSVTNQCAEYALARPNLEGVWGGLSERQRRSIRYGKKQRPTDTEGLTA